MNPLLLGAIGLTCPYLKCAVLPMCELLDWFLCRETKTESDAVKSADTSTAIEIRDQVEYMIRRNHAQRSICDRYNSLADLCSVFGIEKRA